MLPPLALDPRFTAAIALLDEGDWLEASDAFEELWFEAVAAEVPIVRVLLQVSTGLHHTSRGQMRAAAERLTEGLAAIDAVEDDHGIDLEALLRDVTASLDAIAHGRIPRLKVVRREPVPRLPER